MTDFNAFFHWLTYAGLEYFGRFYSTYEAVVTHVDDPEKLGRIRVQCKKVGNQRPPEIWAYPAFPGAGNQRGFFWPPEVGDFVWVAYPNGKIDGPPVYFGGWYAKGELPDELGYGDHTVPKKRGFVTRGGHSLVFDDSAGDESVELTWHKPNAQPQGNDSAPRDGKKSVLKFLSDGSVELSASDGSGMTVNITDRAVTIEDKANSNTITLDSSGVRIRTSKAVVVDGASSLDVKAASINLGDPATQKSVLGDALLEWLNQHTHPTGVGPSAPPTVPATPALLSTTVKLKP